MDKQQADSREQTPSVHELAFGPLTETQAQQICSWRYPPPYDIFNRTSWQQLVAAEVDLGDAATRSAQYVSITDRSGQLCGFAQLFPLTGTTRLGIGLRPDLCGQGMGTALMQRLVDEARRRAPGDQIDLEVPQWNERAIKAYQRAGFTISDSYPLKIGPQWQQVYCMVLETSKSE